MYSLNTRDHFNCSPLLFSCAYQNFYWSTGTILARCQQGLTWVPGDESRFLFLFHSFHLKSHINLSTFASALSCVLHLSWPSGVKIDPVFLYTKMCTNLVATSLIIFDLLPWMTHTLLDITECDSVFTQLATKLQCNVLHHGRRQCTNQPTNHKP